MESDEILYAKLLRGELAAFDRLYERFERPLFGFVSAQLRDRSDAEDVCHETFVAVLQAGGARTELRSFKAWLFQVARNLCLNRIRTRQRTNRALETAAQLATIDASGEPSITGVDAKALHAAVERLPSTLAEVYQLRATGLSYDELATILGIPLGTVKSRMHEMVKRLREEVSS